MTVVDRSAPGVRLTLLPHEKSSAGTALDFGTRLLSFAFEDSESKADKLTLTLDNFDLALFDREELLGGAVLDVSWGYPGAMAPPRRVVVKSIRGFQSLTLEGQALSALLNQHAKTRRWESATRADVVGAIAKEHGYAGAFADIEETNDVLDVINQTAETDAWFLKRLAAREGFAFWIDQAGLHFHRRKQDTAPAHVFTWYSDRRGEVLSIQVESDLAKRAGAVTVRGRDPFAKTTFDASSSGATAQRSTLGEVVEVVDPKTGKTTLLARNATASVATTSASTATAATREAEARFVKAERDTVKLAMQVVGDPTLAAKTVVEVRGISPLLSGKYYVTDVKHAISSAGYTCDLKLTRDAKGKGADDRAVPQTGDRNVSAPKKPGVPKLFERVDPKTGESHLEYRDDGAGSADPEATGAH